MNQKSRRWCFTINNPELIDDQAIDLLKEKSNYLVYQLESGQNNTRHYQGYIEFKIRKQGTTIKNILQRAHLQVAKGTAEQNTTYCTKQEGQLDGPWISGEPYTTEQGKRTDLDKLKKIIDDGGTMQQLADESFGSFIRYNRGLKQKQKQNT